MYFQQAAILNLIFAKKMENSEGQARRALKATVGDDSA